MPIYTLVNPLHDEKSIILCCDCQYDEHNIKMMYYPSDFKEYPEGMLFISYCLNRLPFWRRIWHAIRYIFGYKSMYGDYGEIVASLSDVKGLAMFLGEFIELSTVDN